MIYVGTSGYNYPEWRGTFYPADLKTAGMFAFYAERFHTVEINYTFYRMPTAKTIEGWTKQAPAAFIYALKAPQRITHVQRLTGSDEAVRFFCDSARGLGPHLGPLLFQLPPTFRCDVNRLEAFLQTLPPDLRTAIEFRHASWLTEEVYGLLSRVGAALCIADFGDKTTPVRATARHGYLRLRDEGYGPSDLARWADIVLDQPWDDAFVFFKHEEEGKGPGFARAFTDVLAARRPQAS